MSDNTERFKTLFVCCLFCFAVEQQIWNYWNACGLYSVGAPFKIFMDYLKTVF